MDIVLHCSLSGHQDKQSRPLIQFVRGELKGSDLRKRQRVCVHDRQKHNKDQRKKAGVVL